MIKVVNLKPKSKTQFEVEVEDKETKTLTVHQETVIQYKLLQLPEFSEKAWRKLLEDDRFNQAYALALSKLSYKSYTPKKLSETLSSAKVPSSVQVRVIEALKKAKYIDEKKQLEMFVDDFLAFQDKGPKALEEKLYNDGFSKALVLEALASYTETIETKKCLSFLEKTLKIMKPMPKQALKQKLFQKAYQRGFSQQVIESTTTAVLKSNAAIDETELLLQSLDRYIKKYDVKDHKEKQKLIAALLRQGYQYETIKKAIEKRGFDEEV